MSDMFFRCTYLNWASNKQWQILIRLEKRPMSKMYLILTTWGTIWHNWFGINPDSKVHGANMGPTWVISAPDGPHVGPMNLAIREYIIFQYRYFRCVNDLIYEWCFPSQGNFPYWYDDIYVGSSPVWFCWTNQLLHQIKVPPKGCICL